MTKTLSDDQVAKLRKTTELILGDVDSYDQTTWGRVRERATRGDVLAVSNSFPDYVGVGSVTTEFNAVLAELRRLERITRAEPACGTAFCFAGHYVVNVAGHEPRWSAEDADHQNPGYELRQLRMVNFNGTDVGVSNVAQAELGLSNKQADLLFSQYNSLRRVVELVYLITDGEVDLLDAYHDLAERRPDVRDRDLEFEHTVCDRVAYVAHPSIVNEWYESEAAARLAHGGEPLDRRTFYDDVAATVTT